MPRIESVRAGRRRAVVEHPYLEIIGRIPEPSTKASLGLIGQHEGFQKHQLIQVIAKFSASFLFWNLKIVASHSGEVSRSHLDPQVSLHQLIMVIERLSNRWSNPLPSIRISCQTISLLANPVIYRPVGCAHRLCRTLEQHSKDQTCFLVLTEL